jgi:hypothetical protein
MKNTKLIIALALALGLAACGNQPKSNENTDPTPATVTETPFDWGMLKLGMEIPKTIEGCTIEPVTYMAEGEQQVEYAIKKDGKTLAILEPEFDVDLMELTNKVGVIAIHSEEYQTDKGFHVGSNINDIFAAYPDMLTTGYAPDGNLYVDLGGTQFVVSGEDYAGTLPELSCDEGELIAEPTFKPDAKVKVVRLYKWDF